MDILSYLTTLIKTHKEVGIEGLGTFYKKKVAGRYDVQNHSFIPPSYTLNFSSENRENSLLKAFISKKRNISAESADYYISVFLEDINAELEEKGEAQLGEIGKLLRNDEGLVFQENNEVSSNNKFYGLPVLEANFSEQENNEVLETHLIEELPDNDKVDFDQIPTDSNEDLAERNNEQTDSNEDQNDDQETFEEISEFEAPHYTPAAFEIETTEDLQIEDEETEPELAVQEDPAEEEQLLEDELPAEDDDLTELTTSEETESTEVQSVEKELPIAGTANIWHFDRAQSRPSTNVNLDQSGSDDDPNKALWIKIAIAIGILAAILIAIYFINPSIFGLQKQEDGAQVAEMPNPTPKAVTIDTVKSTDTARLISPAPVKKDSVVASKPVDSATTWEIIGASLTKKEVRKYIADMKAKGIDAKPIPAMPGRRIKMSIATFSDEKSAKEGRKALVKKLRNDELYIHQNKHTYKPL